jgi:predicted HicB family RNase H-like nuclease
METKTQEKKRRTLWIKADLNKHLEKMAKEENISVNKLIERLLTKASGYKEPN